MVEPFVGNGDPDRRMMIELAIADLKAEGFEQQSEVLVRRVDEIDVEDRQFIEQAGIACPPARLPACPPARLPACPPARLPACPPR